MSSPGAADFDLFALPLELWGWGVVTLLMTATIGFAAGVVYARMSARWALRRASRQLSRLFVAVLQTLETAQDACSLLERFPNLRLTPDQTAQLDRKRNRLIETVANIVAAQHSRASSSAESSSKHEEFHVEWVRTPQDATTGLPDRSAFDANLEALLAAGKRSGVESGLLLVRVDKFDHLKSRFGGAGAEQLLKKMAVVLCRAIREDDAVCRFGPETFAVLIPAVDAESGRRLAESIRNSVRCYHFRLEESGAEVLVTASFGYTCCLPDDDRDLALSRSDDALTRSRLRGRNQLHYHNGQALACCMPA